MIAPTPQAPDPQREQYRQQMTAALEQLQAFQAAPDDRSLDKAARLVLESNAQDAASISQVIGNVLKPENFATTPTQQLAAITAIGALSVQAMTVARDELAPAMQKLEDQGGKTRWASIIGGGGAGGAATALTARMNWAPRLLTIGASAIGGYIGGSLFSSGSVKKEQANVMQVLEKIEGIKNQAIPHLQALMQQPVPHAHVTGRAPAIADRAAPANAQLSHAAASQPDCSCPYR